MRRTFLILPALVAIFFSSCYKNPNISIQSQETAFILQAHKYFNDSILAIHNVPGDYKSQVGREIIWEKAKALNWKTERAILVPLKYNDPLFVKTTFSTNSIFNLNNLTQLLVYATPDNRIHAEVITYLPDTTYLKDPSGSFSGFLFADDWWGNNLDMYLFEHGKAKKYQTPDIQSETLVRTCNMIYGYNYASGDPGGGYSWVQAGGCYYMYLPDRVDDVHGGLGGGSGASGGGGGMGGLSSGNSNITVAPPDNPIANIADYMKCFTNVGGSDHTYTVTICVQQPIAGDRAAYKWVDGGPIGSSNEGNIVNVGHTFLIFSEQYGNTTVTRNAGFYPSTGVKPGSASAPGKLNNDETHSYNIAATFSVTNANFFAMLNNVAKGNNPGFYYNLSSENCTTFALQTLAQGGINLPNTIGSWPGGMGCNPGDLGEDIRQMTLLPNMAKSTVQNYHPNIGNCQ